MYALILRNSVSVHDSITVQFTIAAFILSVSQKLFDKVKLDDVEQARVDYKEQTPSLFDKGMSNDSTLLKVLAIGRVHGFDYLR